MRYDAIGHADPAEWFNVRVFEELSTDDEETLHRTALRNAIAFAKGTRYENDRSHGFAAYELWRQAFDAEDVSPGHSHHHANILSGRRLNSAAYLRELVPIFPEAAEPLSQAAAHYDREVLTLQPLLHLFSAVRADKAFTAERRAEAGRMIGEALEADREAIASIEAALALMGESP